MWITNYTEIKPGFNWDRILLATRTDDPYNRIEAQERNVMRTLYRHDVLDFWPRVIDDHQVIAILTCCSSVSSLRLFLLLSPEWCPISWKLNPGPVKWWSTQLLYYLDLPFPRCLLVPLALQPNSLGKIRWANWALNIVFPISSDKCPLWSG